ncbi:MAG: thiolase family protein [Acidobacteria bacterium]|nr:thiolase family protein [Acidobacteriota bacterium]
MSYIAGSFATAFGRHEGQDTLGLMTQAATGALADAGLERADIDGIICGYSTTMPHLMLATVFAEHFGIRPRYAAALQLGGATGLAMAATAHFVIQSKAASRLLIVAGENRLSGQTRDSAIQALAQVGHPRYEVPLGTTVPAYYGLIASAYLDGRGAGEADLAELAVAMRSHAVDSPGAHYREPITVEDVLVSRAVAEPLKLLDCCPVSDGGAAMVVTGDQVNDHCLRVLGSGQAHQHQHVSVVPDLLSYGAGPSSRMALDEAGIGLDRIRYAAVYDSFTVTLALLLEEIGLAPPGQAGALARDGHFSPGGAVPLNTHGGLLSYGHCGVAGAMSHMAELQRQLTGRAGARQIPGQPDVALLHGDGGVMSSHTSMVVALP